MAGQQEKTNLPSVQMTLVDEGPAYGVQCPTDGEIIELLAVTFEASEDTVTRWLVDLVKGLEA